MMKMGPSVNFDKQAFINQYEDDLCLRDDDWEGGDEEVPDTAIGDQA